MKEMCKTKKFLILVIIAIIIAGIISTIMYGFNKGILYSKSTLIEVNIPEGYEKSDIKQIANEVFNDKNIRIQDIEKTNQVVGIRIKNYTQEELKNFKSRISEKYDIKVDELTLYEIEVPETRLSTIISPYVLPVSLVTILSTAYILLKNIKNDGLRKIKKILISLTMVAGLYFSIIVIAQIPVNEYIMPIALAVYITVLLITVSKLNKE